MLELNPKILNALRWITEILNGNNIPYKIGGGFAAKFYGSTREVNDIDISLSGEYFPKIVSETKEYIVAGPKHYLNEKWNCNTLSLNYQGQDIDITDVDTLKMTNLEKDKWIRVKDIRLYNPIQKEIGDIKFNIMDPRDLIAYKMELDGEHQLADVKAIDDYFARESK